MLSSCDSTALNYLQVVGYTVVSVIVLLDWVKHGGLGGGVGGGDTGSRITLNR